MQTSLFSRQKERFTREKRCAAVWREVDPPASFNQIHQGLRVEGGEATGQSVRKEVRHGDPLQQAIELHCERELQDCHRRFGQCGKDDHVESPIRKPPGN